PYATFFYALAAWQAHSFIKAGLFLGLILISALSMYFLIWTGLKALLYLKTKNFEAQYAFRELARRPADTITSFVALCLGILLASLIFVVESSLRSEFDFGDSDQRPSLFLFDI